MLKARKGKDFSCASFTYLLRIINNFVRNLAPENGHHGGYAGLAGMTVTVNGSSPGLSLSLDATGGSTNNTAVIVSGIPNSSQTTNNNNNNTSTANHNHAGGGSPVDHSSLIILQPSGAAGYSSMLPSFTHYASGKSEIKYGYMSENVIQV